MGWTIVQPCPSHIEARKIVSSGFDISNFAFSQITTAIEQPLQDEELLTLPKLFNLLQEVDRDDDNCFLMRGKPVGQNADLTYGLTDSNWIDCSSKQFQLDLDNETDLLNQDDSLDERVAVALEELPFLKNCRLIAQLSSSAGLGIIKKGKKEEDKSKKYCLRLWVETDKAYSCAELRHHLAPFSSLIDLSMYEPTRRHYIMRGSFPNTPNSLVDEPHLKYIEGKALSLDEIPGKIIEITRKKKKTSSLKPLHPQKKTGEAWKTLYSTNREYVVQELERLPEKELAGQRNNLLTTLFRNEALFASGDCALLVDEVLNSPNLMGDRSEKNIRYLANWSGRRALAVLKQEAEGFRNSHYSSIHNFHEIDLAERDWSNILDDRAVAIRSCMGTNKTKGVIYDLVRKAKAEEKSVLIITPLVAVTEQIAKDVKIEHYHSRGTSRSQKIRCLSDSKHLALCYQSLEIFNQIGKIPQFDIVIIDEASQVFRNWADQTQHLESMDMLFDILDRSQNAIIMDADIDDELCLWGLSRIANFAPETSALYLNSASRLRNYEIALEDNYGRTIKKILKTVKSGKKTAIFVDWADDKFTLSAFLKYIEKKTGKKGKAFDSKTVRERAPELKSHPNKTISGWMENDELDFMIVSPWCNCGWDYLERGYDFDEVFVISTAGFFSAQKIKQMLRRMRMTRKASVYLTNRRNPAWKNETFKAIEKHKGKTESDLERIEAWQVRAKQAHEMDLANVPWLLEELLIEGGAIVEKVISSEKQIEDAKETQKEWEDFKKQAEKEYADKNKTPREEALRVLSNFRRAAPHAWLELNFENLSESKMKTLVNRDQKLNADKVRRFCRLIVADDEERAMEDEHHITQFNVVLGKLLDAFWFQMEPLVDAENFISFAHWYSDQNSQPIFGEFEDVDLSGFARIAQANMGAIKDEFSGLGRDAWKEPNRILRPLVQSFDLSFKTKQEMDKLPKKQRIGAIAAEKNLLAHYEATKEPGFIFKAKAMKRKAWCLKNIKDKQKRNEPLCHDEQMFMLSRKTGFVITRKEFVSSAWLEGMVRARNGFEDRSGVSENHTRYCGCVDCQESELIGQSL